MESFTAQCLSLVFRKISLGSWKEVILRDALKAGVAEFISTLIFVFAGSGCDVAIKKKLANGGGGVADIAGLIAIALAHAFAFIVAVSVGANMSGGHVNPAITFGVFVGGHISLFRSLLYWISQLLGSTAAVLLLKFVTDGLSIPAFGLSAGLGVWNAVVFEIVMTFGLVYTVYATAVDPRRGNIGTLAPMTIGFIIGANILAGWAFEGASMNPALSFGPALVSGTWTNHWVYWVGPLIGGGLAAVIYNFLFMPTPLELPTTDY